MGSLGEYSNPYTFLTVTSAIQIEQDKELMCVCGEYVCGHNFSLNRNGLSGLSQEHNIQEC